VTGGDGDSEWWALARVALRRGRWVRNIRAHGGATIRARGKPEGVRVREQPPAEAAPVIKTYLEKYGSVVPFFDAKNGDPVERFAAEASRHPVFEIVAG
jgi:hypothetical protein